MDQRNSRPRYRVVVAEDNELIRELLAQQLVELGHTVVGKARNGREAVQLVAHERPDVVVLDRGLPIQDGLAASMAIAAQSPTAVVVLSAYMSGGDPEEEARAAGAHSFLAKPYLIEELDETLEQAVHRFKRTQP
ncbi:MAG TPA: response regulator [Chloroflexota bacterium]|nr:response regulator [Chloroflexota bacterium]